MAIFYPDKGGVQLVIWLVGILIALFASILCLTLAHTLSVSIVGWVLLGLVMGAMFFVGHRFAKRPWLPLPT